MKTALIFSQFRRVASISGLYIVYVTNLCDRLENSIWQMLTSVTSAWREEVIIHRRDERLSLYKLDTCACQSPKPVMHHLARYPTSGKAKGVPSAWTTHSWLKILASHTRRCPQTSAFLNLSSPGGRKDSRNRHSPTKKKKRKKENERRNLRDCEHFLLLQYLQYACLDFTHLSGFFFWPWRILEGDDYIKNASAANS